MLLTKLCGAKGKHGLVMPVLPSNINRRTGRGLKFRSILQIALLCLLVLVPSLSNAGSCCGHAGEAISIQKSSPSCCGSQSHYCICRECISCNHQTSICSCGCTDSHSVPAAAQSVNSFRVTSQLLALVPVDEFLLYKLNLGSSSLQASSVSQVSTSRIYLENCILRT